jgi:hypothetical protein
MNLKKSIIIQKKLIKCSFKLNSLNIKRNKEKNDNK